MGSPRFNLCSRPLSTREGKPDLGLGRVILPFRVSANTDVRKFAISSSFVIPFFANIAERVPFGITTPSKTTSAALSFFVPTDPVPFHVLGLGSFEGLVAPPGLEPGLSALKGPRVNQLHHGAKHTTTIHHSTISRLLRRKRNKREDLVALPGLEPGLFALRGRRVNQLHHNAKSQLAQEETLSRPLFEV